MRRGRCTAARGTPPSPRRRAAGHRPPAARRHRGDVRGRGLPRGRDECGVVAERELEQRVRRGAGRGAHRHAAACGVLRPGGAGNLVVDVAGQTFTVALLRPGVGPACRQLLTSARRPDPATVRRVPSRTRPRAPCRPSRRPGRPAQRCNGTPRSERCQGSRTPGGRRTGCRAGSARPRPRVFWSVVHEVAPGHRGRDRQLPRPEHHPARPGLAARGRARGTAGRDRPAHRRPAEHAGAGHQHHPDAGPVPRLHAGRGHR